MSLGLFRAASASAGASIQRGCQRDEGAVSSSWRVWSGTAVFCHVASTVSGVGPRTAVLSVLTCSYLYRLRIASEGRGHTELCLGPRIRRERRGPVRGRALDVSGPESLNTGKCVALSMMLSRSTRAVARARNPSSPRGAFPPVQTLPRLPCGVRSGQRAGPARPVGMPLCHLLVSCRQLLFAPLCSLE